jgi:hypothetical protein
MLVSGPRIPTRSSAQVLLHADLRHHRAWRARLIFGFSGTTVATRFRDHGTIFGTTRRANAAKRRGPMRSHRP